MTSYEWVTETIDEYGDIVDTNGWRTLTEAIKSAEGEELKCTISLRRDIGDDIEGLQDRTQAYSANGFDNGSNIPTRFIGMFLRIPEKFRDTEV